MSITILGLGYGDPQALTLEAQAALRDAAEIYLRTREHPTVGALPVNLRVHSFDHLYDELDDFDAIYATIADVMLTHAEHGDVLFAVPGHPLFGETSVQKILEQARARKIPVRVIAGVSFVDAACVALALDPLTRGLQIADATDLARQHFPRLDPDQPALIGQLYSRAVASDCKLTLMLLYPPEHAVTRLDAAGTPKQAIVTMPLAEMDHVDDFGLLTTLYVPPLPRPSGVTALAEIVAHLRAPNGCPWDREQTHQSLRKDFLEECYEVLETLDENDSEHLREELGDLLLHVLFQAQIAAESGEFLLSDVAADISAKLVRRHPHVFGDVKVKDTDEIIANWDAIKQGEHGGKPQKDHGIPRTLPAIPRAEKIAKRVKAKGNLKAIALNVGKLARTRQRERVLGEILFELVAYARDKHVDAESALREYANQRLRATP